MLRITTHEKSASITFQLEGKLAGLWVDELAKCWRTWVDAGDNRGVHFDLTGLTFIDDRGKELLSDFRSRGAKLTASGCLMRAFVAELADCSRTRKRDEV